MAITEKITCDVCGIERGPANHWIVSDNDRANGKLSFHIWTKAYQEYGHLCGSGCATKLLEQQITVWRSEL
jgi:hypothetical protein